MKTIFVLLILVSVFNVSAQRVLTDDERQTLLTSQTFLQKCKWAVRNHAEFLLQESLLTSASTNQQKKDAVKDLIIATAIKLHDTNDGDIPVRFLNAAKGKTFSIGAAPLDEASLIAAWDTSESFEEFAPEYFKMVRSNPGLQIGYGKE